MVAYSIFSDFYDYKNNDNFQTKQFDNYSYFCSLKQFQRAPTIYVLEQKVKQIMHTPVQPSFSI